MSAVAVPSLAPDPVFAQRDALLDEDELRARLSVLLGASLDACTRVRATYHPGRSLRLLLRVSNDRLLSARAYAPGTSRSRFERARAAVGDNVRHDEELATVFFHFPADRKLTALARLDDGAWPRIPGAP